MIFSLYQILGWGRSMGPLRRTISCSSKRKIGGQLWCLIWLKEVQFFAPKKLDPVASWIQADIRRKKKSSNRRVERVVSRQIEEKKDEKKEAYFVPKYRRKTICARNIRGFLFIRKNSCSRLRFGNSFRYSKETKKEEISSNRKKYVKIPIVCSARIWNVVFSPCFTLRVFINLW